MRTTVTCPCGYEVSFIQRALLVPSEDEARVCCPRCNAVLYDPHKAHAEAKARHDARQAEHAKKVQRYVEAYGGTPEDAETAVRAADPGSDLYLYVGHPVGIPSPEAFRGTPWGSRGPSRPD